jgi:hypothetical protein
MRMQMHTHIDVNAAPFPELDALRAQLRLSQSYVCREAAISPSTYVRWRKWADGEPGGCCPTSGLLRGVRQVLAKELQRTRTATAA